jgi:hypothetical protein
MNALRGALKASRPFELETFHLTKDMGSVTESFQCGINQTRESWNKAFS